MQHTQRARLMRLSWQIQKRRHTDRSKSLFAAWAIFLNEDVTVWHLVEKHSKGRQLKPQTASKFTLFTFNQ
jgi:hypothetical protein